MLLVTVCVISVEIAQELVHPDKMLITSFQMKIYDASISKYLTMRNAFGVIKIIGQTSSRLDSNDKKSL